MEAPVRDLGPPAQAEARPARSWAPIAVAVLSATAFVALTVLVATHVTQPLDVAARGYFRPHDEWGPAQLRADLVVEGLKPRNIALLLAGVGIGASLRRRSWRPVVYAGMIATATIAVTLLSKVLLQRPDPHYAMTALGGSFPSGHTVTMLVCLGGAVLVLRERSRWWQWLVVVVLGLVMGLALLVQAAHWLTDVVGGVFLGLTLLALASLSRLRGPLRGSR